MNNKHGYVRKGVLWWLLEEGQLTVPELQQRIGAPGSGVHNACQALKYKQLIVAAEEKGFSAGDDRSRTVYGLTRAGIDLALTLPPQNTADTDEAQTAKL
jgi:predicted ArsR family transcriptional regulator